MFYTIYKITNKINGKIYLGKHQTRNIEDNYYGSGKLIKDAIKKYGKENFEKEILFVFDNEKDMNRKEKDLITEEFVSKNDTYNLGVGGEGGPHFKGKTHSEETKLIISQHSKDQQWDADRKEKISINNTKTNKSRGEKNSAALYGKPKTDAHKENISKSLKQYHEKNKGNNKNFDFSGKNNSQYGTIWITNGTDNKKIDKNDFIPEGWYKGRKMKRGV